MPRSLAREDSHAASAPLEGTFRSTGGETFQSVAAGLFLVSLVLASSQLTFILSPLATLIHETGHAAAAWLFGYPAIPSFDFLYGGGVTPTWSQVPAIPVLISLALAALAHRRRRRPAVAAAAVTTLIVYNLAAWTRIANGIGVSMGYGMEMVIAAVFLERALSGRAIVRSIERPLYAMCGFYLLATMARGFWELATDPVSRYLDEHAKDGHMSGDVTRLASEYLGTSVQTVAWLGVFGCALALVAPVVANHLRPLGAGTEGKTRRSRLRSWSTISR